MVPLSDRSDKSDKSDRVGKSLEKDLREEVLFGCLGEWKAPARVLLS